MKNESKKEWDSFLLKCIILITKMLHKRRIFQCLFFGGLTTGTSINSGAVH
jgi:hypothetical protein